MTKINDVLDELEKLDDDARLIMIDDKPTTIKAVIDRILSEDKDEKKRRLAGG